MYIYKIGKKSVTLLQTREPFIDAGLRRNGILLQSVTSCYKCYNLY